MAQTSINIRMDEDLKRQFSDFCSDIGMNMTTAFCVFAKKAVREQRIPFEVSAYDENGFSAEQVDILKSRIADLEAGNGTVHELIES